MWFLTSAWGATKMRKLISILLFLLPSALLAQVINCPVGTGFNTNTSGACSVSLAGFITSAQVFNVRSTSPVLSGTALNLIPSGSVHLAAALIYQTPVNVQGFTSTFTFVGNGQNIAFVLQNTANAGGPCPGTGCQSFAGGAGGEAGCSQAANGPTWVPNNIVCLELDSYDPLTNAGSFTYSSAQLYVPFQVPFLPINNTAGYIPQYYTNKLSTSPVSLTQAGSQGTCKQTVGTTCDTFSATVTYDGSTVTLTLFDVTASGSCPGASCFTQTWTNVSIPSIVGSNTAYPTITGATGTAPTIPLLINSLVYTVNSPTATPATTSWSANSTYNTGTVSAASPVYSVAPGTYSGTQTVAITTSSTPHNYICYVVSPTAPAFYPQPDNNGGCVSGTLYSSPISISSTTTLYARAGSNNTAFGSAIAEPAGLGPPSTLVAGTYTISGTVYNVNNTMSQSTIQSTLTTADATPGNFVVFAAGNYTGWTGHMTLTCYNGTVYTGPGTSAGVKISPVNGAYTQQTTSSPAVLNSDNNIPAGDVIFAVNGGSGGGCTIQNFTFDFTEGVFLGGIPNGANTSTSNVFVQFNTVKNLTSTPNPGGVSFYINSGNTTVTNSSIQYNWIGPNCADTINGFTVGPSCGAISLGGTGNSIINNVIDTTEEGIGSSDDGTGNTDSTINATISGNLFRHVHRIMFEYTNGNSPSRVDGMLITHNGYVDPYNPWALSFAMSMACCNSVAPTSGHSWQSINNVFAANATPTGHFGYCFEFSGGTGSVMNGDLCQGNWPGAALPSTGIALENNNTPSIVNVIAQGALMSPSNFFGCEASGTFPGSCNGVSGTVTFSGAVTGATPIQQTSTTPSISPGGGVFGSPPTVTVSNTQANTSHFCTQDGSTPTTASQIYTGPFVPVSLPVTVKCLSQWGTGALTAYAWPSGYGYGPSSVTSVTYTNSGVPAQIKITGRVKVGGGLKVQ